MFKSRESNGESEPNQETSTVENPTDIIPEAKPDNRREARPEAAEEIEELREEVKGVFVHEQPVKIDPEEAISRGKKIREYQEEYLPDYLRGKPDVVSRLMAKFLTRGPEIETEGKEKLPKKGPFIVICNHFGGGDTEAIMKTFKDYDLHFAVGREWANWDGNVIKRWFFKKLGMIPVEESLSNLTPQEREEATARQDLSGKKVFEKINRREKAGVSGNIDFVRQAIAALSQGDALCVFPEGPFLNPHGSMNMKEKEEMKQGYRGIELIARWYQELTGEQLPIIPTAFIADEVTGKKKLSIGEQLLLKDNDSGRNGTDWCMSHVAKLLPEEQRGYYKDMAEK